MSGTESSDNAQLDRLVSRWYQRARGARDGHAAAAYQECAEDLERCVDTGT